MNAFQKGKYLEMGRKKIKIENKSKALITNKKGTTKQLFVKHYELLHSCVLVSGNGTKFHHAESKIFVPDSFERNARTQDSHLVRC